MSMLCRRGNLAQSPLVFCVVEGLHNQSLRRACFFSSHTSAVFTLGTESHSRLLRIQIYLIRTSSAHSCILCLCYLVSFSPTYIDSAISRLPTMVRKLQKTQPKSSKESPKANILKTLGGRFKKAFSRKKQVCIYTQPFHYGILFLANKMLQSKVDEEGQASFHHDQPGTAAASDSTHENEQSPAEDRPASTPTPISVDQDIQNSDNTSQVLAEATPQSPVVSSTGPVVQERSTEAIVQDVVELDPSTPQGPRKPSRCGLSGSSSSADFRNGRLL